MRYHNRAGHGDILTQNFLQIGYHAWNGYRNSDRGVVVISVDRDLPGDSDRHWESSQEPNLNFRYISQPQLIPYLEEWLVPKIAIESILPALTSYQPDTELIFALESAGKVEIAWCQNLKIAPPDCHQQISRRWSEFSPRSRG